MRSIAKNWMQNIGWQGCAAYLQPLSAADVYRLLSWLAQLPGHCFELFEWESSQAFDNARSPAGLIKWHMEKQTDPGLTATQYGTLIAYALWNADTHDETKSVQPWLYARWEYIDRIPLLTQKTQ